MRAQTIFARKLSADLAEDATAYYSRFYLVFSYVIGHELQTIAAATVPSSIKDPSGRMRAPSDRILDPDDQTLASKVKAQLEHYVTTEFETDLGTTHTATGSDDVSSSRTDVLCRGLLIRQKAADYIEQFEGLYAMIRGLTMAFLVGFAASHILARPNDYRPSPPLQL
jgi:hypothetical protein